MQRVGLGVEGVDLAEELDVARVAVVHAAGGEAVGPALLLLVARMARISARIASRSRPRSGKRSWDSNRPRYGCSDAVGLRRRVQAAGPRACVRAAGPCGAGVSHAGALPWARGPSGGYPCALRRRWMPLFCL